MLVNCIICEEANCYSCFFLKLCKKCSLRVDYIPTRYYQDSGNVIATSVFDKMRKQESYES